MIGAGVAWDVAAGLALLLAHRHRWVYAVALIGTVAMTLIATWLTPHMWLHPMGPLFKNIVIWAALWVLYKAKATTPSTVNPTHP